MIECSEEMVSFLTLESFVPETTLVERLQHVQNLSTEEWDHLNTDRDEPFNSQRIIGELTALIEEFGDEITVGDFVEEDEVEEDEEDDEDIDDDMDEEDTAIEE